MNRRDALLRMGGAATAVFLGACSKSETILGVTGLTRDVGVPAYAGHVHTVLVTVEDHRILVDPENLRMSTASTLRWVGTNGRPFSILFDGKTPFADRALTFGMATSKSKPLAKGRFKYTIISDENPKLQLDPDVIVNDPPSEPHP